MSIKFIIENSGKRPISISSMAVDLICKTDISKNLNFEVDTYSTRAKTYSRKITDNILINPNQIVYPRVEFKSDTVFTKDQIRILTNEYYKENIYEEPIIEIGLYNGKKIRQAIDCSLFM